MSNTTPDLEYPNLKLPEQKSNHELHQTNNFILTKTKPEDNSTGIHQEPLIYQDLTPITS